MVGALHSPPNYASVTLEPPATSAISQRQGPAPDGGVKALREAVEGYVAEREIAENC